MNRNAYNKIAQEWNLARNGFFGRERDYLDALLTPTSRGSLILDFGCGTGRPMAEYVISQGRHILGVDQSEEMLNIAKQNLPSEQWVLASIEAYEPPAEYQGAIIWDCLFHIQRSSHAPILRKVIQGLTPGGRLMITVGGSEHPEFTDSMFGQQFYYDSHSPQETERILQDLACDLVIAELMNIPDGGRDKGRYAIVAEKARHQ